jgi:uncharacterized protein (TIGR01244 family)
LGGSNVVRLIFTLAACLLVTPAYADNVDQSANGTLKVEISQVVAEGKVSPVDGITTSGQPNVAALRIFADSGYTAVIDLRGVNEDRGFDQRYAVEEFGMTYVNLPIEGRPAVSFENAEKLDEILAKIDGPVLLHCKSGNRAAALLALRASLHGSKDEAALALGRQAGLTVLEDTVRERLAAGPD